MTNVATTDAGEHQRRVPVNRAQVVRSAVELADVYGLEARTMRRLGQALGVDPMAISSTW